MGKYFRNTFRLAIGSNLRRYGGMLGNRPPPPTHTHFVWGTPRWGRHSLEFPRPFFQSDDA